MTSLEAIKRAPGFEDEPDISFVPERFSSQAGLSSYVLIAKITLSELIEQPIGEPVGSKYLK